MYERKLLAKRGYKTIGVHCIGEDKCVSITSDKIQYYFIINDRNGLPIGTSKWNNNGPTTITKSKCEPVEYKVKYGNHGDTSEITYNVVIWAEKNGIDYQRMTETERLQFSLEFMNVK